jgi:uncharacterized protein YehS (DUF1456 family)
MFRVGYKIAGGNSMFAVPEINFRITAMTNNDILKKLRVALKLKNTDIIEIMKLVDFRISESELGALFRREDHPNYKECGDQILRNFLNGLVIHLRGPREGGHQDAE